MTERFCRAFQRLTGKTNIWLRVQVANLGIFRTSFLTLSVLLFGSVGFVYINLRIHLIFLTYALIVLTTVVLYLLACDALIGSRMRRHPQHRSLRSVEQENAPWSTSSATCFGSTNTEE